MKRVKHLLTALLLLCGVAVNAQKQEVGGLYYEILGNTAVVTSSSNGNYTGDIVIPETVTFGGTLSFDSWTSTNKNDNSYSQNTYTLNVIAGDVLSFDWSVSSEATYDKLIITLDEQEIINESGEQSGSYEKTFDAVATHTLVVKYTKDYSQSKGSDEGRIYNIAIISSEEVGVTYSVASIGASAFAGCTSLTSITIPKNVTSVGDAAFDNCTALKELRIEDGEAELSLGYNPYNSSYIGEGLFCDCPLETLYLGRDLNYNTNSNYGYSPFGYKTKLTDIVIGDSVTKIGMNAFKECSNLASIEIPNNVTNIYADAFSGCTNLKKVKLNTTEVGEWFRGNRFIKEVVLGNSVKTVSSLAFNNCSSLASVTVGSKVASIGTEAFSGCYVTKAFWLANTPPAGYEYLDAKINYVSNNEYGYFEGDVVVTQFLSSKFEVDGMEFIPVSFSDKKCCVVSYDVLNEMPDVVINDKISYKGVEMAVEDVMPYSFYRNDSLSVLTLRNSGSIGKSAFEYCDSLKNVEIPATVTAVGDYAFRSCEKLEYAVICDRETVLPLGLKLFDYTSIDSLYVGGKISYSQGYSTMSPFNENSTLRTVVIADAEHNIYDYEFYDCSALETVTLGDGIENIGRWAFSGCSALTDFCFGVNLVSIGEEAFSDCVNMRSITGRAVLPPLCGDQALDDIVKWDCTLTVPSMYLNEYKEASQWREFYLVEELVTNDKYITYKVDGEIYKTVLVTPGSRVTMPTIEDREGYTFSWNYDEEYNNNGKFVMPDKDIVVLGEFTGKDYTVTYKVEGEEYLVENVACGSEIVLPEEPIKEGYSFTGWVDMPEVMPAGNIVVEASFAINTYTITYLVDEKEYKVVTLEYGAEVPVIATPTKRGHTFTGWNEVLETMPGEDVVIFGSFVLSDTAIDEVDAELADAVVYDINGVRVEKITKAGIYIVNGVKKFVK